MRCSICDYSTSVPSLYSQGLSNAGHQRRVVSSKDHGFVCTDCLDAIQATAYYDPNQTNEFEDTTDLPDDQILIEPSYDEQVDTD